MKGKLKTIAFLQVLILLCSIIAPAIKELGKPVYTISKVDEFYLKNGFVYDNADLTDKECKTCEEYNVTCFPQVVVYKQLYKLQFVEIVKILTNLISVSIFYKFKTFLVVTNI